MKKCFLALLFGIIFSAVAFAENNTSGLLLKVGMAVQPNIVFKKQWDQRINVIRRQDGISFCIRR